MLYFILFVLYLGLDHCRQEVSVVNKMTHSRVTSLAALSKKRTNLVLVEMLSAKCG
jgi:hypothetical protein